MTPPVLEVKDLAIRFGGVHALDGVSLALDRGEVLGLAGDNGAGKSTLIKIISGVYPDHDGELCIDGRRVALRDPQAARAHGIETIYQDLALADNLDVGANIFLGREPMLRRFGWRMIDRAQMRRVARELLDRLAIEIPERKLGGPVRMLSGGQRQAIAIARAIHWNARVLIMDEPTAALGVPEQRKVMELIRSLKQSGVSILLISHQLHDLFAVSDRIVVLRRGHKAGERRTGETSGDEIVRLMVGDSYAPARSSNDR